MARENYNVVSGDSEYPPVSFYFKVTYPGQPGMPDTSFKEVSGLSVEVETSTLVEGGENRYVYQLPEKVKHPNLVLKRGIASVKSPLIKWCKDIMEGGFAAAIEPKVLQVALMDSEGKAIRLWTIKNAYPVKLDAGSLDSQRNEVAIETLELAYSHFIRG